MSKYKTSQGKVIDIEKLRLMNEKTIAVGNMKVNARGDQLGQGGKIVATRNELMSQKYKIQGTIVGGNHQPQPVVENVAPDGESFDPPELEETVKPVETKLRGSLADSIAKQTTDTVNQTPKGPQRI
jgi:hypothetical protein